MSIKEIHTHPSEGKRCFRIRHRHETGNFTKPRLVRVNGYEFTAAFKTYTSLWYLFNAKTGDELGTMKDEMFEVMTLNAFMVSLDTSIECNMEEARA